MDENLVMNEDVNEVLDLEEVEYGVDEYEGNPNSGFLVGVAVAGLAGLAVAGGVKLYKAKVKPWISKLKDKAEAKKAEKIKIDPKDFEDAEDEEDDEFKEIME